MWKDCAGCQTPDDFECEQCTDYENCPGKNEVNHYCNKKHPVDRKKEIEAEKQAQKYKQELAEAARAAAKAKKEKQQADAKAKKKRPFSSRSWW
jgi:predicted nucleotidyltransferase